MKKRGQFYLIAAIILSLLILGFISMTNYSQRQTSITVSDFGKELNIESKNVLDFGTYSGYSQTQMHEFMKNFSTDYINNVRDEKESYFIFGDGSLITVVGYSEKTKTIFVGVGTGKNTMTINAQQISQQDFNPAASAITITIEGEDYSFALKSGKNFYFILFEEIGDEEYAVRN